MADKYMTLDNGRKVTKAAADASAGAADAGKIVALDAAGKLAASLFPAGIGSDATVRLASESLSAGNFVNVWDDAGTAKVRKADASAAGKEAHGYVLGAATAGQSVTVYWDETNSAVSGLTAGVRYYLSATNPGQATATPPSAAGNVLQYLGTATSATELPFEPDDGVVLG